MKSKDTIMTNHKTYKNDYWKGFLGFETITSMFKVIIYYWIFYIILRGQILGNVSID
jgi:hypothetical protein